MINYEILRTLSEEELNSNRTYYRYAIDVMTKVDHKAPEGACCGKNKKTHIKKFIDNRDYYLSNIEKLIKRTIKPKWKGIKYCPGARVQLNANILTDDEILSLIENNIISRDKFDWTDYVPASSETPASDNEINE